jgi:hypothetical protein
MTLAIMQPYFFPYLGHYQLMLAVDCWVTFDLAQYRRKSWMNRNRVLHPKQGWQYVSVPAHAPRGTSIRDARIVDKTAALERILRQLEHYRGRAPYFGQVRELIEAAFAAESDRISDLNVRSLAVVASYLEIPFRWSASSELRLELPQIEHPGQWALEISAALGATRYVNPPGGRALFHVAEWEARAIELRFLNSAAFRYDTSPYEFQEGLSVLDVLMWNSPSEVRRRLAETLDVSV